MTTIDYCTAYGDGIGLDHSERTVVLWTGLV